MPKLPEDVARAASEVRAFLRNVDTLLASGQMTRAEAAPQIAMAVSALHVLATAAGVAISDLDFTAPPERPADATVH